MQISTNRSRNEQAWSLVQQRSDDICAVLGCTSSDFEIMERYLPEKKFVTIPRCFLPTDKGFACRIDEKEFVLCVMRTYGVQYGGEWKNLMQVFCVNDKSLNQSIGGGTAFVTVIAENWHQAFLDKLKNEAVALLEAKMHTLQVVDEK
jgi:hypothetical protein